MSYFLLGPKGNPVIRRRLSLKTTNAHFFFFLAILGL
jgi:hypothetical protein